MSKSSDNTLFFYQGDKLITIKRGEQSRAIFRNDDIPLAEIKTGETSGSGLLATDDKGSVLSVQDEDSQEDHRFAAYGHDPTLPSPIALLGFNGERLDTFSCTQLLGDGHRAYSPPLMHFYSADTLSPFSEGGLNAYMYCQGDPINRIDPSGRVNYRYLKRPLVGPWKPRPVAIIAPIPMDDSTGNSLPESIIQNCTSITAASQPFSTSDKSWRVSWPEHHPDRPTASVSPMQLQPHTPLEPSPANSPASARRSSLSSIGSTDSFDEWYPNPATAAHEQSGNVLTAFEQMLDPRVQAIRQRDEY